MVSFSDYGAKNGVPSELFSIMADLVNTSKAVYAALGREIEGKSGRINMTGDEQVAMDVVSNDLLVEACKKNQAVSVVGSEELPEPLKVRNNGYSVVFDPLDGSSLADVNLAVGTIVGVFEGSELLGKTGRDLVASMIVVYGPRLTFLITFGDGVDAFLYDPEKGDFFLHHARLQLKDSGTIMGPGNVKIAASDPWYFALLEEMAKSGYSMRYSGGMVPDVYQILLKGGGIYMYPGSQEQPEGKLRLLYECAPMALLMEQAGGQASNGTRTILDIEVKEFHQRTPIFLGSSKEVELAISRMQAQ